MKRLNLSPLGAAMACLTAAVVHRSFDESFYGAGLTKQPTKDIADGMRGFDAISTPTPVADHGERSGVLGGLSSIADPKRGVVHEPAGEYGSDKVDDTSIAGTGDHLLNDVSGLNSIEDGNHGKCGPAGGKFAQMNHGAVGG